MFNSSVIEPASQTDPAYWFAFAGNKILCHDDSLEVIPLLSDISELGLQTIRKHYLGALDGRHCFAVELDPQGASPAGAALRGLRELYSHVDEALFAVAGRAAQIVDWDRTHQFCGRCGAKTVTLEGERAKRCL